MRFEHVAVGMHVDLIAERRMRGRAVVALEEVLGDDLPVRGRVELDPRVEHEVVDGDVAREDLRQRAELFNQRPSLRVRIDEQERPPGGDARREKRPVAPVEAGLAVRSRSRTQGSVEAVGPRVVVTLDRAPRFAALCQHGAAMPADVDERAQLPVVVAGDEDGNAGGVGGEVRTGLADVRAPAGVLPRPGEDLGSLAP